MATATIEVPGVGAVKREHLYVAGAVVGGIVVIAYVRRGRDVAEAEPEVVEPTATQGDYASGVDAYDMPAGGSTVIGSPASEVDPDTLPPTTNAAWTTRAVSRLSEVGWDPKDVASALGRYLGRQPQANTAGVEIVRTALAMVGSPPSGEYSLIGPPAKTATTNPGPTKPAPKPTSSTTPKPKAGVTVTVRRWTAKNTPWQSSIGGIAKHYGRSASYVWGLPQNADLRRRRKVMSRIQPGDRVYVIPK